jgi:ubiquinone/menaquinone biosynthesis C-methylase UbiE
MRRLTRFYDPIVRWTTRESTFKQRLVKQAQIQLDLGCGTGTLTILAKKSSPHARVAGLTGDAAMLEIARRKAAAGDVEVAFDRGSAVDLPYADHSFDRVLSSLLFHQLTRQNKRQALREVLRVLRPGGEPELVVDAGLALVVLLVTTTLSVYKPWGRILYEQRTQRAERPQEMLAPSATSRNSGEWLMGDSLPLGVKVLLAAVGVLVVVIIVLHLTGHGLHHSSGG